MQHVDVSEFLALSPVKAKAQALAMFETAQLYPLSDWQAVAYALHSVVTRKRGKTPEIHSPDDADASEFATWADYQPYGKGTAIARGRVTVTFADGYSKTVGMLAGKTGKGRKPWSVGQAVRFAVICYKLDACRRITGSDHALYFERGGNAAGETIILDGLISAPEIVSVVSAESAETVAGDLAWNPCEANAATLDQRAGKVAAPGLMGPHPRHFADDLRAASQQAVVELIYDPRRATMRDMARHAADRVAALLYPVGWSGSATDARVAEAEIAFAGLPDAEEIADATLVAPASTDNETMRAASEIVGTLDHLDVFSASLSPVAFHERFRLVEDAMLAWPALMIVQDAEPVQVEEPAAPPAERSRYEAAAKADGWLIGPHGKWHNPARNSGAAYTDTPRAFRNICEDHGLLEEPAPLAKPAPAILAAPPSPKPRYRFSAITGLYELVTDAPERLAA